MKRSKSVSLVLMASGAGLAACGDTGAEQDVPPAPQFPDASACIETGVFTASYCDQLLSQRANSPAPAFAYQTPDECIEGGIFTSSYCTLKYEEAQQLDGGHGPRYDTASNCESTHGPQSCSERISATGQSFWSPFLTGYLVSTAFNSFGRPYPYYNDRDEGYYTIGGTRIGTFGRDGRYTLSRTDYGRNNTASSKAPVIKKSAAKPVRTSPQRTTVATRGGFGGRSGGRGG